MACPLPPRFDRGRVARFNSAMTGGAWADAADREAARAVEARYPGAGAQLRAARYFHASAAARAVTQNGARGIIIGAAGYPQDPDPHTEALAAGPSARAVYCYPVPEVCAVSEAFLAGPRVGACRAAVRYPGPLLADPAVAALPRPWCLLLCLAAHFWPSGEAASILAGYGRLLPPGSVIVMTWWLPDGSQAGRDLAGMVGELANGRVCAHPPGDVTRWLEDAGMVLMPPGMRDVQELPHPGWAGPQLGHRPAGRVIGAMAAVPL